MFPTPKGPLLQASVDFCGPFPTDKTVLVILDTYYKYPEVAIVPSTAAKDTIPASGRIFPPNATGAWHPQQDASRARLK